MITAPSHKAALAGVGASEVTRSCVTIIKSNPNETDVKWQQKVVVLAKKKIALFGV